MAINFNELPSDKPVSLTEKGTYIATITKAEMKQPADAEKPPYLNLALDLTTNDGKPAGKIYDIISESTHELMRYKLKRFVLATGVPITGNFDLKDLVKILPGKIMIADVTKEESKDSKYPPKSVIDIFHKDIYYSISERAEIFGEAQLVEIGAVFAPDADDAEPPFDTAEITPIANPAPKAKPAAPTTEY